MIQIKVLRPFRHVVTGDIHATLFETGLCTVDDRTAEVAFTEGWAVPFNEPEPIAPVMTVSEPVNVSGLPSPASGPERQSSSPRRGRPPKRRT